MAKKKGYQGHRSQFLKAARARDVYNGVAQSGAANTRENRSIRLRKPSIPSNTKNPGVNGSNWAARK
jgi:hypothetical protein